MQLSKDFIQKVKDATDMVDLASEYTELKQVGRNIWRGQCPHPNHNDPTPSFTIDRSKQNWCCYGCHTGKKNVKNKNYGTDCIAFIRWINQDKLSWFECVKFLADRANIPMPNDKNAYLYQRNYNLNNKYIKNITEEAYDYLLSRGLDKKDIIKFGIGFDLSTNRITFPLVTFGGIVGFNKRRIDDVKDMKYIHSSTSAIFNKSSFLYGLNFIDRNYEYIFITEGVMDVILATKYGLKNVVCVLGSAFTEEHYNIIKSIGLKPVFLFDNDKKGNTAIDSAMELIYSKGEYSLTAKLPPECDLADYSVLMKDDLQGAIESSITTYGYTNAHKIIDEYNRRLYAIKASMRPKIDEIMKKIPESERKEIKGYLEEELKIII